MAPPTGAKVFRNAVIEIDATEYTNQVARSRLVPDTPIQTYRTLVPDGAVQDVDSAVWTWELRGLQINIAGGLAKYLRDNAGTQIDVVMQDEAGTGKPQATFTVIATHVPFGGDQGAFLQLEDITLPVVGQPVFGTSS